MGAPLRALWLLIAAQVVLAACVPSPGPFRFDAVRGRVVDVDTGAPIAGAEVIEWYRGAGRSDAGGPVYGARFATADGEGAFALESELTSSPRIWLLKTYGPTYSLFHAEYGLQHDRGLEQDGEILLRGSRARAAQAMADLAPFCRGERDDAGARRLREVACAEHPIRPDRQR